MTDAAREDCPECEGSGACVDCLGVGCATCDDTGDCAECDGNGTREEYEG